MRLILAFAMLVPVLLVAGCADQPVAPRPVPTPLSMDCHDLSACTRVPGIPIGPRGRSALLGPAPDWRDWAVTPGDWVYRVDARGSIALFGAAGANALLTLRCDTDRHVLYLSRSGNGAAPLLVRTSSLDQSVWVQPTGGTPPYMAATLVPHELLLDRIAFSRGRFVVEQAGSPTLVVPAWAEIGRVIEDCRR